MDASHIQNFMCKIVKIWCKTCFFGFRKYPIAICILFLFFLSYMFFPSVYTFLIYSSPLVGVSFLVHRVLLGIDRRRKIKRVEEDDRKRKFAKSRRSFKSIYGDRSHLILRNAKEKSDNYTDTNVEEKAAVFSKSFHDLLVDKTTLIEEKPKEVDAESIVGRGECSSSNDSQSLRPKVYDRLDERDRRYKDELEGESTELSEDEDGDSQDKAVRWTEDDQKNVMDLGLSEAERNKRLESLIERRRSRKNLGFVDRGTIGNNNNGQISAIKITKINPFLEDNSCGMNTPGSAPSSLVSTRNPFDLPYDPHEEKPDLTGDNFHEEFGVGHHKEPIFCRHGSFSLGAFSRPDITHDKHEISFYKDLATKQKTFMRLGTSTFDNGGDYKHIQVDSPKKGESSERVVGVPHEDGPEGETKKIGVHLDASNLDESDDLYACGPSIMFDDRKADIFFFYGGNKRVCHAPSNSVVSDLQVEVSDDESTLEALDIEKNKEDSKDDTNPLYDQEAQDKQCVSEVETPRLIHPSPTVEQADVANEQIPAPTSTSSSTHEMDYKPQSLNSDTIESTQLHESSGASQSSVAAAPDELREVAAPVASDSPISTLQPTFSTDQASPYNFANEAQQSGENPFNDRNSEDLQGQ